MGIPKIPIQPISWGDAFPLLERLSKTRPAPDHFQGGLRANFTYGLGPTAETVHLLSEIKFETKPMYVFIEKFLINFSWNVFAIFPGEQTDKNVIVGNHRDAWVFGATDPSSGSATLLEVVRSFGKLKSMGWKPKRVTFTFQYF
jgi:N-acetylated-alpha-linked acidic dipeptidase